MDGERFDDLTKQVATSSSRRYFLRSLAVAVAGVGFSLKSPQALAAQPDPKCKPLFHKCATNVECCSRFCDKNGKQCVCAPDQIACNNQCTALCHDVTDPCKVSGCDPASGRCVVINAPNGTLCEDGDLCTLGDTCQNGTCRPGQVKTCDNECLECDRSTGETRGTCVPVANGAPCNDGNPCTLNDTCVAGVCTAGQLRDCDDNNPCTSDSCNPATGQCVHTPLPGAPCETGNKCTADVCDQAGRCQQGPVTVTCPVSTDPCKVSVCDPSTGTCQTQNAPNGTPCNDNNGCTTGETCTNGVCGGGTGCPPLTTCRNNVCCVPSGRCIPGVPCCNGTCNPGGNCRT